MDAQISPATLADFHQVLADHPRYWGERDLRHLHLLALVQKFGSTCLVARDPAGIRGYLFGFVAPAGLGYVHLIAIWLGNSKVTRSNAKIVFSSGTPHSRHWRYPRDAAKAENRRYPTSNIEMTFPPPHKDPSSGVRRSQAMK
jgi:hypothetical protein